MPTTEKISTPVGALRAAKTDEKQKVETMIATTTNDLAILFIYLFVGVSWWYLIYIVLFYVPLVMKNISVLPISYIGDARALFLCFLWWLWRLLYLEVEKFCHILIFIHSFVLLDLVIEIKLLNLVQICFVIVWNKHIS